MSFIKKISPEWSLRIATAAMYLYSGQDIFFHPTAWHWALPFWFTKLVEVVMPIDYYLKIQALGEIAIALMLLSWFLKSPIVKWAALFSAFEMAGILLLSPSSAFSITFRDIGLLGGSLALTTMLWKKADNSNPQPISA